jgi:hypothetical protein
MSATLATIKQVARRFDAERRVVDGAPESDYALVCRMGVEGKAVVLTRGESTIAKRYRDAIHRADEQDLLLTVVDAPEATPTDAIKLSRRDARDPALYRKAKLAAVAAGVALLIAAEDEEPEV